ncbi:MAG: hypothetical protein ACI9VI_001855 [Candidatus Azotimanducaceae bacterium]|jgi:hypothetical protein
MKRTYLWLTTALLYVLFFSWYTSFEGPMQDDEINQVLERAKANGRSTQSLNTLENFMRTDTGDDFIMVNLLDINESPPNLPATGPGANPTQLLNHYMEHMYPALFKRASHPIFFGSAVADAMDVSGIEGANHWDQGALLRYRSRRDIIAIATNPAFDERHDYKMAALTKTIAFPVEPEFNLGDFRIVFGLILFSITSLLDMFFYRRSINVMKHANHS